MQSARGPSSPRVTIAANHPLLPTFFHLFPTFTRDPSTAPETDFRRLQQIHGWEGPSYAIYRRAFLVALAVETRSPVHTFFTTYVTFLEYDSTASPHAEFTRLQRFSGWLPGDTQYVAAHRLFSRAFKREFSGPLDAFYRGFQDFQYNPRAAPMAEFRRLMAHKEWRPRPVEYEDEKARKYRAAKNRFFTAFRQEFARLFGGDDDMGTWQELCVTLGVVPIPGSKGSCKKVLRPFMVNIYDLVHHKRTGEAFDFFKTLEDLREYTIDNDLIYPKKKAKEGPLKYLLREILMRQGRRRPAEQAAGPGEIGL